MGASKYVQYYVRVPRAKKVGKHSSTNIGKLQFGNKTMFCAHCQQLVYNFSNTRFGVVIFALNVAFSILRKVKREGRERERPNPLLVEGKTVNTKFWAQKANCK